MQPTERKSQRRLHTTVGDLLTALQDICEDDRTLVILASHLLALARKPGNN